MLSSSGILENLVPFMCVLDNVCNLKTILLPHNDSE